MSESIQKYITEVIRESVPGHSIECVILGYEAKQIKVLLFKIKGADQWSLPGGFIRKDENLDTAAHRILEERAGLSSVFLRQFHTFGNVNRSHANYTEPLSSLGEVLKKYDLKDTPEMIAWMKQRLITTGYYALVDIKNSHARPHLFFERCEWISVEALPALFLDQNITVAKVLDHLRMQLHYLPIGRSLLPQKFTMLDLQKLYEIILKKPLVRSNFQRKMLALGFFKRLEKQMDGSANKAPYLYRFDESKYDKALKSGIGFKL